MKSRIISMLTAMLLLIVSASSVSYGQASLVRDTTLDDLTYLQQTTNTVTCALLYHDGQPAAPQQLVILEELAQKYKGKVTFVKVNFTKHPEVGYERLSLTVSLSVKSTSGDERWNVWSSKTGQAVPADRIEDAIKDDLKFVQP